MQEEEKILFSILKKETALRMMQAYPSIDPEISNWRGETITYFQEDLLQKVNGQISEKWFYTHMKSDNLRLPRIDTLNMLSRYTGYATWQDFRYRNSQKIRVAVPGTKLSVTPLKIAGLLFIIIISLFLVILVLDTREYNFTFFDSVTGEQILSDNIHAEILMENESPVNYTSDKEGKITIKTSSSRLDMIVSAPWYMTDTVSRTLMKFRLSEKIGLNVDSYGLMLSYFSQADVRGWEKRREQLARIISDDAIIYQLPDGNRNQGAEIYNKWEFIDKLTVPSSVLSNIEILGYRQTDGRIMVIRFRIKVAPE